MKAKFCLCLFGIVHAIAMSAQTDTLKKNVITQPKPYKEVITSNAISNVGLFTIHKIDNRFLFEIPIGLLGKDLLVVNRISKGAADNRSVEKFGLGYSGDFIGDNAIRFETAPNNKIMLKVIFFGDRANDSSANGMYRSVLNSNNQPIAAAFDIKAFSENRKAVVIDLTDYLNGDNNVFFFGVPYKSVLSVGNYQPDKSYIASVNAYPANIRINTVKTYVRSHVATNVTFELSSSIIQLPAQQARIREYDMRIGYFEERQQDFDKSPQRVELLRIIRRWKLEPRPADVAKYLAGELVEPQKPIVFYIDPATPKKWVPYLVQGVNDWQKAFEAAGFRNAIYAREAPSKEEDSTWSLEDARYSAIVYKPSPIENASGPSVCDPRTGEILESHINWFHNIMDLLHDWYLIQGSVIDPRARVKVFPDSLMGRLIRYVSSHEVGHTLGLMHNFGASASVPVDSLRNDRWIKKNGICPSIMDYARFNYVAQPGDNISEENFFPVIGDYDKWAIQWGYRWFPETVSDAEIKHTLHAWTVEKNKNPRFMYGAQGVITDPRCQGEDLGDDAMKAGEYGIANLKRVMDSLRQWTTGKEDTYEYMGNMYKEVLNQFTRYMFHAVRYVGARLFVPITADQQIDGFSFFPREKQKAAIEFLHKQLFETPSWLVTERYYNYRGGSAPFELILLHRDVLTTLLSEDVFGSLSKFESNQPAKAYSYNELLGDLERGIWKEIDKKQPVDIYRRNLQKTYVAELISHLNVPGSRLEKYHPYATMDLYSVVKMHVRDLLKKIKTVLPYYKTGSITRIHLEDISDRLKKALDERVSSNEN